VCIVLGVDIDDKAETLSLIEVALLVIAVGAQTTSIDSVGIDFPVDFHVDGIVF
jgi:hypothetical protein